VLDEVSEQALIILEHNINNCKCYELLIHFVVIKVESEIKSNL